MLIRLHPALIFWDSIVSSMGPEPHVPCPYCLSSMEHNVWDIQVLKTHFLNNSAIA